MNSLLKQATQRTLGVTRSGLRLSQRLGRRVASDAFGLVQQVRHLRREPKVVLEELCRAHATASLRQRPKVTAGASS